MGRRPKESIFGLITGGLDIYSANKIRKLGSEFASVSQKIEAVNQAILREISNVEQLQIATIAELYNVGTELQNLSQSSWEILNALEKEDRRQETLGTMKLFLIGVEEELQSIKEIAKNHLVYATYMSEELRRMFRSKKVSIEHFKRMPSTADIKWAKSVIDDVEGLYDKLYNQLGG